MSFTPDSLIYPADVIDADDRRLPEARAYLASRFYPPLPADYAPIMLAAIDLVNGGDTDVTIVLPDHLNPIPRQAILTEHAVTIAPWDLINILRVSHLIADEDDTLGCESCGEPINDAIGHCGTCADATPDDETEDS